MADAPEINITLVNYPPESGEVEIRTLPFGMLPNIVVLLEVEMNDDETEGKIALTIDGGVPNEGVGDFIREMMTLLDAIAESRPLAEGSAS